MPRISSSSMGSDARRKERRRGSLRSPDADSSSGARRGRCMDKNRSREPRRDRSPPSRSCRAAGSPGSPRARRRADATGRRSRPARGPAPLPPPRMRAPRSRRCPSWRSPPAPADVAFTSRETSSSRSARCCRAGRAWPPARRAWRDQGDSGRRGGAFRVVPRGPARHGNRSSVRRRPVPPRHHRQDREPGLRLREPRAGGRSPAPVRRSQRPRRCAPPRRRRFPRTGESGAAQRKLWLSWDSSIAIAGQWNVPRPSDRREPARSRGSQRRLAMPATNFHVRQTSRHRSRICVARRTSPRRRWASPETIRAPVQAQRMVRLLDGLHRDITVTDRLVEPAELGQRIGEQRSREHRLDTGAPKRS